MKNKILVSSIAIILLGSGLASCKKYLDEKANKQQVVLSTLDDLQALLDDNSFMNINTPDYGETSAGDFFVTLVNYNTFVDLDKDAYTWRLFDYNFQNDWSFNYNAIYSANTCLDAINKIEPNVQNNVQWNNVKGSALFYRAYRFLDLMWEYGKAYDATSSPTDAGIVLRLNSDPTIPSVRSSVKDCYNQLLNDTKNAATYLPNLPLHVMRPSKAAAYALLARAYLSMRNYDSAFKYSDLSLQIKSDLLDYNDATQVTPGSLTPFKPFNTEILFYTTQSGNHVSKSPVYALIDTVLYSSYNTNDKRKSVFFNPSGNYFYFKGTYNAASRYSFFTGLSTDEMFLIRAECNARANKITEAMNDLNTLLQKRWATGTFTPLTAATQQQALTIVLTERRKELLMRGLRWPDIKRLNKEGANISLKRVADQVYTLPANDDRFALPLPKDILDLTGMPQNPGW